MDQFGEARELITDATESVGTTYFSEDIHDAQEQTTVVLNAWEALKEELRRSGDGKALEALEKEHEMKMKQLQQELEAAQHAGGE